MINIYDNNIYKESKMSIDYNNWSNTNYKEYIEEL